VSELRNVTAEENVAGFGTLGFFISVAMLHNPIWCNRPSFVSDSVSLPHCSTMPDPFFMEKMIREDMYHARMLRRGSMM